MNVVLCLCKTKPFEMDKRCKIIAIVKEKLNILYMYMVLIKKNDSFCIYTQDQTEYKKLEQKNETFEFEIEKFLAGN